jgi:hypothetical protein
MKVTDILFESKSTVVEQHFKKTDLLVESVCKNLTKKQKNIVENIYREFKPLIEDSLTPDQISKIFTDVEEISTSGGGNRTVLGKAKDITGKVNDIINNVGKWLQNTTPVAMADQKFEQLKTSIATKFPELDQNLTNLGTWMKENPGKSAAIIGVMTALAALAGGPIGGAIAGQVLRGSSELIKGETLSTAVGKGVKTAALGYLSGKAFEMLGDLVSGMRMNSLPVPGAEESGLETASWAASRTTASWGQTIQETVRGFKVTVFPEEKAAIEEALRMISDGQPGGFDKLKEIAREIRSAEYKNAIASVKDAARTDQLNNDGLLQWINGMAKAGQAISQGAVAAAGAAGDKGTETKKESYYKQTRKLSERQIKLVFDRCEMIYQLNEAPIDWLKQKGRNLTTKITANKLMNAWKSAGSPTDSDAIANILKQQGVDDQTIDTTFKTQNIKLGQAGQQPSNTAPASTATGGAAPTAAPASTPAPTATGGAAPKQSWLGSMLRPFSSRQSRRQQAASDRDLDVYVKKTFPYWNQAIVALRQQGVVDNDLGNQLKNWATNYFGFQAPEFTGPVNDQNSKAYLKKLWAMKLVPAQTQAGSTSAQAAAQAPSQATNAPANVDPAHELFKNPTSFGEEWNNFVASKPNYKLISDPELLKTLKSMWMQSGGLRAESVNYRVSRSKKINEATNIFSDPKQLAASFQSYLDAGGNILPGIRGHLKNILLTAFGTVESKQKKVNHILRESKQLQQEIKKLKFSLMSD